MSILCVCVSSFALAVADRDRSDSGEEPLIVVDKLERGHVVACEPGAYALGVRPRMTILQATHRVREAIVVVDTPAANAVLWQEVLDTLGLASPIVEDAGQGLAYLDMRGMPGTPKQWFAHIRELLRPYGIAFHFACGGNTAVTRLAALAYEDRIVAAGDEAQAIAHLPLALLDIAESMLERLSALGIVSIGELAALPYAPFVRRFGAKSAALHEQACGSGRRILAPRPHALRIERSIFGEGQADSAEQLLFALRMLLTDVVNDLARAGLRCGMLHCLLECEDGDTQELPISVARPTAQSGVFFDLLKAKLETTVLRSPVIGIKLAARQLEEGGEKTQLFRESEPNLDELAAVVARLGAFLRPQEMLQATLRPAHRRDEAFSDIPLATAVHQASDGSKPSIPERPKLAYRILKPRALRVACHDGYPVRVESYKVLEISGPWRYEQRWWSRHLREDNAFREDDQFDVLLENGMLWLIAKRGDSWILCGLYD